MNKHMIILPVLLTSAVSLHAISFYIEEPEEIAQNPPISISASASINTEESVEPSEEATTTPETATTVIPVSTSNPESPAASVKATVVPVQKESTAKPTTEPVVKASVKAPVEPSKQPVKPTQEPVKVAQNPNPAPVQPSVEPTKAPDTVKVASSLIASKPYGDIVKEAKLVGGRVDPFLSMKPPALPDVPEITSPVMPMPDNSIPEIPFPDNNTNKKPKVANKGKIKEPPVPWGIPDFGDNKRPKTVNQPQRHPKAQLLFLKMK